MKRYIYWALAMSMFLVQCNPTKNNSDESSPATFTLTAELQGLQADYLIYSEADDQYADGYRRDTLRVNDGKFTFTDSVETYKMYFINVPETSRSWKKKYGDKVYTLSSKANVNRLWFIGYPGAEISYKGKITEYMVDAYPSDQHGINDDLAIIHKQVFPLLNEANAISMERSVTEMDDEAIKLSNEKENVIYEQIKELKQNFIQSYPQSIAASWVLSDAYYRKYYSEKVSVDLFSNLDAASLEGTPFYEEVKERMIAADKTDLGMSAPELTTTNTLDGKIFKLSALKGNYVLLDYWGTWCGPCMGEMPKIKEYYEKYKDRNFLVYGVNSGDSEPRWRKTITKNEFDWNHIRTTKEQDLLIPFNVSSFPTKILIDPEGKIIYSSKNRDSQLDLYQTLDKVFQNTSS